MKLKDESEDDQSKVEMKKLRVSKTEPRNKILLGPLEWCALGTNTKSPLELLRFIRLTLKDLEVCSDWFLGWMWV